MDVHVGVSHVVLGSAVRAARVVGTGVLRSPGDLLRDSAQVAVASSDANSLRQEEKGSSVKGRKAFKDVLSAVVCWNTMSLAYWSSNASPRLPRKC